LNTKATQVALLITMFKIIIKLNLILSAILEAMMELLILGLSNLSFIQHQGALNPKLL